MRLALRPPTPARSQVLSPTPRRLSGEKRSRVEHKCHEAGINFLDVSSALNGHRLILGKLDDTPVVDLPPDAVRSRLAMNIQPWQGRGIHLKMDASGLKISPGVEYFEQRLRFRFAAAVDRYAKLSDGEVPGLEAFGVFVHQHQERFELIPPSGVSTKLATLLNTPQNITGFTTTVTASGHQDIAVFRMNAVTDTLAEHFSVRLQPTQLFMAMAMGALMEAPKLQHPMHCDAFGGDTTLTFELGGGLLRPMLVDDPQLLGRSPVQLREPGDSRLQLTFTPRIPLSSDVERDTGKDAMRRFETALQKALDAKP